MPIALSTRTARRIREQMKRLGYSRPDDVVLAGLAALDQLARVGDFAPGELDKLLEVADREIERGEVLDGESVFRKLRRVRRKRRSREGA
jgi:hypothetical protein